MSAEHSDSLLGAAGKVGMWVTSLVGSITLSQVNQSLGIIATLLVIAGSGLNFYTALRHKAWRRRPKFIDSTAPAALGD